MFWMGLLTGYVLGSSLTALILAFFQSASEKEKMTYEEWRQRYPDLRGGLRPSR
jgi:hypothetical protein